MLMMRANVCMSKVKTCSTYGNGGRLQARLNGELLEDVCMSKVKTCSTYGNGGRLHARLNGELLD